MTTKMKELPNFERPYEKLEMYGEDSLTNSELLAIIIKTGTKEETALDLARKVLTMKQQTNDNNMRFLQDLSLQEFMKIKGIGKVKAIQLKAVFEIAKRISRPMYDNKIIIKSTEDVAKLLHQEMQLEKREIAKILILNNKNVLLKVKDIAFGGTNFAMITPKDVLLDAIKMQAQKVILVHNHPSGDPTPSKGDIIATQHIVQAASLMGIELLDHVVIGDNKYESVFSKIKNERIV